MELIRAIIIEENLFMKRTLRNQNSIAKPRDEKYRILRMETKYEFLLKDYMCLNQKSQRKQVFNPSQQNFTTNYGEELFSYQSLTLVIKSCLLLVSCGFYTPLQCDLALKVDLQVCPCVRIEFLLNSRSSHTGVPVHVSGVPVHFGYCHFST